MFSYKSIGGNLARYLVLMGGILLTAGSAAAQIPNLSSPPARIFSALPDQPSAAAASPDSAGANSVKGAAPANNASSSPAKGTGAKPQPAPAQPPACGRTVKADVVAFAQPIMMNRLGAALPNGLIFALKGDTVSSGDTIRLRDEKRPRPLVLRANVGDCIQITFTNAIPFSYFATSANPPQPLAPSTSEVSLHIQGLEWVKGPQDDGSFVGKNNSSLASVAPTPPSPPEPPQTQTYTLYVREEGTFLMYTMGDTSSQGTQLLNGLFGALNVQPAGAEWYRSQVSATDLNLTTYNADHLPAGVTLSAGCQPGATCTLTINGKTVSVSEAPSHLLQTLDHHPIINYNATYSDGKPILKMLDSNNNIVHTDLTAIITGPNAGRFPGTTGPDNPEPPCNAENNPKYKSVKIDPLFCENPAAPDRKQPYREITVIYHGALGPVATQAFPVLSNNNLMNPTTDAGQDAFAINYGTGGIGAEIYANRVGVGPMGPCADCKFEEFFLSAWPVGDPAELVDIPANSMVPNPFPPTNTPATPPVPLLSTGTTSPVPPPYPPPQACNTNQLQGLPPNTPPTAPCANTRQPNAFGEPYTLAGLLKATRMYYPDDPSNVYHSYINDHVKFRILHGGTDVSHVHHQHAHQWLQSPNSDESSYLDSQLISPGASYTLEMVYNGSGNRNKVVGDSIFHCHFYPHFAAGMWAMWRTHDTFESGTYVYPDGKGAQSGQVVSGSRALPDGEITGGVPTPAIVPMPTLPTAPLPAYAQIQHNVTVDGVNIPYGGQVVIGGTCEAGNKINGLNVIGGCTAGQHVNGTVISSYFDGTSMTGEFQPSTGNKVENPGYPFFVPGVAGARAPHPPLDFAPDGKGGELDGGLPRHVITSGSIKVEAHTATDWTKDLQTANASQLPENGTDVEKAAIDFFHIRCHPTYFPDGKQGSCPSSLSTNPQMTINKPPTGFILNGLPNGPQHGAPYADPAVDDNGKAIGGAPRVYKAAAIQLDVTFNRQGWHFPQQRILTLWQDVGPTLAYKPGTGTGRQPEPLFIRGNSGEVLEYWHTNLVPNYYEQDAFQVRTPTDILGQHIHLVKFDVTASDGAGNGFNYEDGTFSPEEVQELYTALTQPGGSWLHCPGCSSNLRDPETQKPPDEICSGPEPPHQCTDGEWAGAQTTIQRWFLDPQVDNSNADRTLRTVFTHDHFGPSTHQQAGLYAGLLVEPKDSQWVSNDGKVVFGSRPDGGPTSWQAIIKTKNGTDSYREFMLEFQDLQLAYATAAIGANCPQAGPNNQGGKPVIPPPACAINSPTTPSLITTGIPAIPAGTQSLNYTNEPIGYRIGQFGDLSFAFDNATYKNIIPPGQDPDPITPLMRAYQNDNVQVRVLVGAHVFAHQFDLEGPIWFSEASWKNSGYRSAQAMGLSEHFELLFHVPSSSAPNTKRQCPDGQSTANCVDYLYSPSLDINGLTNGLWGLFRSYDPTTLANGVAALPNNPISPSAPVSYATCPSTAPKRTFNVTAVTAEQSLGGTLIFNTRGAVLQNTLGVAYVRSEDLESGKLKPGVPIEPLVLRANAGDCISINLNNGISPNASVLTFPFQWQPPFTTIPVNDHMSSFVGLHPQLLGYDMATSSGAPIGWNSQGGSTQVTGLQKPSINYQWYAGKIDRAANGQLTYKPVEFGALNLFPSDPMFQAFNGLIGQMVIEPQGSTWQCGDPGKLTSCDPVNEDPPTTRTSATVKLPGGGQFREFSLMISDNIRVTTGATNNGATSGAVNYKTEPWQFRYTGNATIDFSCMLSNQLASIGDPETPIFKADVGDTVRFRMTHPYGTGTSQVFSLHGHVWQRNPYTRDSTQIGFNNLSQWLGSRDNHGSTDHFDMVIDKAGGAFGQAGDYLYTAFVPLQARTGTWGLFRVGNVGGTSQPVGACTVVPAATPNTAPPQPNDDSVRFTRPPLKDAPKNNQ